MSLQYKTTNKVYSGTCNSPPGGYISSVPFTPTFLTNRRTKKFKRKNYNKTFVQCQNCGNIFLVDQEVSIDDFIVNAQCQKCGNKKAINCGNNREDVWLYANVNVDERYYIY